MLQYANIARRGVAVMQDNDVPPQIAKIQELIEEMPSWGIIVMISTLLAGVLLICSVRYTLQDVMATLAMVESPQTTVIVRDEKRKLEYPDVLAEDAIDSEIIVIKQVPITAHIRTTLQLLQSRGGLLSRWRGLSAMFAWTAGYALVQRFLSTIGFSFVADLQSDGALMLVEHLSSIGAFVVLGRLGLTWTHIVISMPSERSWFQRIPSHKAWRQIYAPTLYTALAFELTKAIPAGIAQSLRLTDVGLENEDPETLLMKISAVALIALITFVGIAIPADVALTRVQASIIPDEDESIVSFDRTFGGAVVPETLGGSGKLGYFQAWRSFNGAARLRLLKLYVKIFMVEVVLHAIVLLALMMEFMVLVGPKAYDLLDQVAGAGPNGSAGMAQAQYEAVVLGS